MSKTSVQRQCPSCGGGGCNIPCEYGTEMVSLEIPKHRWQRRVDIEAAATKSLLAMENVLAEAKMNMFGNHSYMQECVNELHKALGVVPIVDNSVVERHP